MLTVDFDYFDLQPGHICVDLGCGEGRHSLTAYMAEGVTVLGFDLAFSTLKRQNPVFPIWNLITQRAT